MQAQAGRLTIWSHPVGVTSGHGSTGSGWNFKRTRVGEGFLCGLQGDMNLFDVDADGQVHDESFALPWVAVHVITFEAAEDVVLERASSVILMSFGATVGSYGFSWANGVWSSRTDPWHPTRQRGLATRADQTGCGGIRVTPGTCCRKRGWIGCLDGGGAGRSVPAPPSAPEISRIPGGLRGRASLSRGALSRKVDVHPAAQYNSGRLKLGR